jgi:ABC-type antimicrobial peptide transport system permease subunit
VTVGLVLAAIDELKAEKLRMVLSAISVIVGITTLTLIVAAGQIGQAAAAAALERQVGRPATLAVSIQGIGVGTVTASELLEHINVRAAALGATASRLESAGGQTVNDGLVRPTQLRGVDPELATVRGLRVESGRWLSSADAARYSPVAVVNLTMADEIGLKEPGLPQIITVRLGQDVSADVVGIVDDGEQQSNVYLPADMLERWMVGGVLNRSLLVLVSPDLVGSFSAELHRESAWWGGIVGGRAYRRPTER